MTGISRRELLHSIIPTGYLSLSSDQITQRNLKSDWPAYGFDSQNTRYNPRSSGPVEGFSVEWVFDTGFWLTASPAIDNGTVYIPARDGNFYAVNASTGIEQWRAPFSTWCSPTVFHDTIFLAGTKEDLGIVAIDKNDGSLKWKFNTEFNTPSRLSPAVYEDSVYQKNDDGTVFSIDHASGEVNWRFSSERTGWDALAVDSKAVYTRDSNGITAIGRKTGKQLWQYSGSRKNLVGITLAVGNNTIYTPVRNRGLIAIDANTGEVQWRFEVDNKQIWSAPAIDEEYVYFGGQRVYSIDRETGQKEWESNDIYMGAAPAITKDMVYVGSYGQGKNKFFGINKTNGHIKWTFGTGEGFESTPAVANGKVFLASKNSKLYALGPGETQRTYWVEKLQQSVPERTLLGSATGLIAGSLLTSALCHHRRSKREEG